MKKLTSVNPNCPEYWDTHQTATDFGLRQRKYLELAGKGDSMIELGCGFSPTLFYADFSRTVGVDYSERTVKNAQRLYPHVEYIQADATDTKLEEEFDVVISGEVIEHLEKPELLLEEMNRLCKKGGIMILSTPHLEFSDPEHLWEFSEEDFIKWGFEVETVQSDRFKGRSYLFAYKRK